MSRIYENGYRIVYPNEMAYSGMPMIVQVSNADNYIGAGITIKVGEDYHTETRTIYNGGVTFDISRYAQMAFVGKSLAPTYDNILTASATAQPISASLVLTDTDGNTSESIAFDILALYGYIGIQQTNGGGVRTRKWFANFPQSFDIYATPDTIVLVETEHGSLLFEDSIDAENLNAVSVALTPNNYDASYTEGERSAYIYAQPSSYLNGDSQIIGDTTYKLSVERCKQGVYLRWLDHFGHWCYYLFRATGRNYATSEEQTWQDSILRNELAPDERGVLLASGQTNRQLASQESISLGAKLVDAETFDYLLSLASSPIVEVLANAEEYVNAPTTTPLWERVSIVAGSYARTGAPLQDFEFTIARRAHNTQML